MADSYPTLCKTVSSTSGTSNYVLSTTPSTGPYKTPEQAVAQGSLADGDWVHYEARDTTTNGNAIVERGLGQYDHTLKTISRSAANVYDSPAGPGSLYSWPASGQRDILILGSIPEKVARVDRVNTFDREVRINPDSSDFAIKITADAAQAQNLFRINDSAGQYRFRVDQNFAFAVTNSSGIDKASISTEGVSSFQQIGIGTGSPHASSALDVTSTSKGILPPRMTTAQVNAISSPATGLVVYDTDIDELKRYDGTAWVVCGEKPVDCLIYKNNNQSIGAGSNAKISWTSEDRDGAGAWASSPNPTRITVPTGYTRCEILCGVEWVGVAEAKTLRVWIEKNGSTSYVGRPVVSAVPESGVSCGMQVSSGELIVTAGDYFEINANNTGALARNVLGVAAGNLTWLFARFWKV